MRSIKTIVCLLFLLMPVAVRGQVVSQFLDLSAVATGSGPEAVAVGDVNGDGFLDIATANYNDSTVSIAIGRGDGSYLQALTVNVGSHPYFIALADLNGDGLADLIVSTTGNNSVQVLISNGFGTFQNPISYPVGNIPGPLQVADFTGDGILDIAVVTGFGTSDGTGVALLAGKGGGAFAAATQTVFYPTFPGVSSISAGDFNGDGHLDLVATLCIGAPAGSPSGVDILLNSGTGTFTSAGKIVVGTGGLITTTGDFNNDGKLDLAIHEDTANSVEIFSGNGNGTFQTPTTVAVPAVPQSLVAVDLNSDGNTDLVSVSNTIGGGANQLSVMMGSGHGTFQAPVNYPTLAGPTAMTVYDVNRDGLPDILVVDNTQNAVQVFLDTNTGTLITGSFPTGGGPSLVAAGDFNGDGLSDIAVYNVAEDSISIYMATGQGTFAISQIPNACEIVFGTNLSLVTGHFATQTADSLVVNCTDTNNYSTFLFNFSAVAGWVRNPVYNDLTTSLNKGDFNGDGITDLVEISADGGPEPSFPVYILENLGTVPTQYFLSFSQPLATLVGDFNGDGATDLMVSQAPGNCYLSFNLGANNYNTVGTPCGGVAVGDFNGDGIDDILAAQNQSYYSLISNGHGTFTQGHLAGPQGVVGAVADYNGDGIPDVIANTNSATVLWQGAIDGSFNTVYSGLPQYISQNGFSTATGDFDGNGSTDIVAIDHAYGHLDVYFNKSHFTPTTTTLSVPANLTFVLGQPVTLAATVKAKTGVPTGTVVFKALGNPVNYIALVGGTAQGALPPSPTVGQAAFTAVYTGDGTFSGSRSSRFLVTINPAHTTTTVTSSVTPKLGQSFTVTATVAPQYSGTPTGTVQFYLDGEPVVSSALVGGSATASLTENTLGKHTIEANYSGDSSFVISAGVLKVTVGRAASAVLVTASANPAIYGTGVTLTALVTDSESAVATGPVVFKEGATIFGTVSLSGGGAQITLPTLTIGTHKITAQYGGDTADGTASGTISEVIQGMPTTTTVVSNTQPSFFGQNVTFTATISAASGAPDGTLTFKNGNAVLGTVTVTGGQANLTTSTLTAGTHTINAVYNGGTSFAGSSGSVQQIVEKTSTSTALSSSLNPATTGSSVTFTATVTSTAVQVPTGNITFKDGKTSLGTIALVNGHAQLSTALLTKGTHTITVSYAASANFTGGSTTLTQTMQ